jgi:uncharacterized protein
MAESLHQPEEHRESEPNQGFDVHRISQGEELTDGLDPRILAGNGYRDQGASSRSVSPGAIGRVASPLGHEATTGRFSFWVAPGIVVEKGQLVVTESRISSDHICFYGVVEEVYRRSRAQRMDEEVDRYDGDLTFVPPFAQEGLTYATATIIHAVPPLLTPPLEANLVAFGSEVDAYAAYGYDQMLDLESGVDWGVAIGLLRNGRAATLGVAKVDLRMLTGALAGHLNVTGQAGRGTKSSFLTVVVRSLIDVARAWDNGDPRRDPFSIRTIVFNVKGNDLMYLDMPNRQLTHEYSEVWRQVGVAPQPFAAAQFVAPCAADGRNRGEARLKRPVPPERQTETYYWTLEDVVRFGLWPYLFSDETQQSETMMALADHILGLIADDCPPNREHPAGLSLRRPQADESYPPPKSFEELNSYLRDALTDTSHPVRSGGVYTFGTCRALLSRLDMALGREGRPIFDGGRGTGKPLQILAEGSLDPLVIDIATLPTELRRFVVAAVLDQVKTHQTGATRTRGQVYLLVLDELGIYAPRGGRDPITKLFEHVAAQLRSQGVILLGAQQQASKVSETIFGNSEVKALGISSPVELDSSTWRNLLSSAQKARVLALGPEEKLVLGPRGWMNVLVPFPAWAMKEADVDFGALATSVATTTGKDGVVDRNGPAFPILSPDD